MRKTHVLGVSFFSGRHGENGCEDVKLVGGYWDCGEE